MFGGLSLKGLGSVTSILCSAAAVHPISPSSSMKILWYLASRFKFIFLCPRFETGKFQFFEENFPSLLNGESSATFFSPSVGSKCSYSAICHHCLRNFICCNHPGHRSLLLQNYRMVLSVVQLDICLSTATVVHSITGPYMQSSREGLIIPM